jgi:phosphatidylserine/phosphatidylglycerophosphate/cardiolipin synthase-like enzyme
MIDTARRTLTLSSFGVFPVSWIGEGLRGAAARGVVVRVILGNRPEDANWLDWRNQQAFGRRLPDNFALYHWPVETRLRDDAGNQGLMHAKCAIADRECLFLTSANLSGNAMAINMELGVCIHGGPLPEQVERHLRRSHRKGGSTGLRMSGSARKAAPVAEVKRQVVRCVGESRCRGRSISESDPTIQTARKHNTTKLERSCPGSREMRNRED